MVYQLLVAGKKGVFNLSDYCLDEITYTTHKTGYASSLNFTVARNIGGEFVFFEGDCVQFFIDGELLFQGFIFSKERNSDHFIRVTAYDQLRYLKNKDSYNYSLKTASDVVLMIINDFKLSYGMIDNSKYVINNRIEENKSLFDIILNACNITYKNTGEQYFLFDKAGRLYFKELNNLKSPFALSIDQSVIDFNCKTDIDTDTFSQVKLYQRNKTKKIDKEITVNDKNGIEQFGVLQYYEKMPDEYNDFQLETCAKTILKEKNRVKRTLNIKCIGQGLGEHLLHAGNSIFLSNLDIGEEILNNWECISKCVHSFKNNEHIIEMWF